MTTWRILVVDDEPLNLHVICDDLGSENYQIETTLNAEAALEMMGSAVPAYDLVILDRIMPGMDGLELLERIKADARFKSIPVVMQTAASSANEVAEGIAAGAYYYLTKPYERASLQGIVRAALTDREEMVKLISQSRSSFESLKLLKQAHFQCSTLQEAKGLAVLAGSLCPEPDTATMGLAELLINAIEHGNLGISYEEKKRLRQRGIWEDEVECRLQLPQSLDRFVSFSVDRRNGRLTFRIEDQGSGFDWPSYLDFDPSRASDPNGRGIAMARLLAFSSLTYEKDGRVAVATIEVDENLHSGAE
jgi:CheY-like chemotaxis protein/anti-sigma regulatory factor (Ser/Thr protein kinase)